jgi:transcriptional regulator with XRE-family HTH domain
MKMCSAFCVTFERIEMSKKPHEDTRLAKFVERRVLELKPKKSQLQIASEAGFPNPNMVTMIKNGSSKLAMDRVPSMARALECDPAYLMRLALEQAVGDTSAQAIVEIFGTPVTANELGWLQEIREASDNSDPRMTSRSKAAIKTIFGR